MGIVANNSIESIDGKIVANPIAITDPRSLPNLVTLLDANWTNGRDVAPLANNTVLDNSPTTDRLNAITSGEFFLDNSGGAYRYKTGVTDRNNNAVENNSTTADLFFRSNIATNAKYNFLKSTAQALTFYVKCRIVSMNDNIFFFAANQAAGWYNIPFQIQSGVLSSQLRLFNAPTFNHNVTYRANGVVNNWVTVAVTRDVSGDPNNWKIFLNGRLLQAKLVTQSGSLSDYVGNFDLVTFRSTSSVAGNVRVSFMSLFNVEHDNDTVRRISNYIIVNN